MRTVIPRTALIVSAILLVIDAFCAILWRRWLMLALAPAPAELAKIHPLRWNALFLSLLAAVTVLATNSFGAVVVIARRASSHIVAQSSQHRSACAGNSCMPAAGQFPAVRRCRVVQP